MRYLIEAFTWSDGRCEYREVCDTGEEMEETVLQYWKDWYDDKEAYCIVSPLGDRVDVSAIKDRASEIKKAEIEATYALQKSEAERREKAELARLLEKYPNARETQE